MMSKKIKVNEGVVLEARFNSNASFEKEYLEGKYGGTPIVGDFSKLFVNEED